MSKEIERKFIIVDAARVTETLRFSGLKHQAVEQGYLEITPDREERIRMKMDKFSHVKCVRTVKAGTGLVREEQEWEISREEYRRLFPLTAGRRVLKTRYELPLENGLTAEIDVYHGKLAGHVVVEVEYPDEKTSVVLPAWLGGLMEVTENTRFKNQRLAVYGWPTEEV